MSLLLWLREEREAVRVLGFWYVIWCLTLYRPVMKLAHRWGWHYTGKPIGPFEDGSTQLWCKWCGLRQTTPRQTLPGMELRK